MVRQIKHILSAAGVNGFMGRGLLCCAVLSSGSALADMGSVRHAQASYRAQARQCDEMKTASADVCKAEAKAALRKEKARLRAETKPSADASRAMQEEYAKADYELALAKCADLSANEKDVCKAQAKAARTDAVETAKTNRHVLESKTKLAQIKNDSAYDVARKKCDLFVAAEKDECIAQAKLDHGK